MVLMAVEPLAGQRIVKITKQKTKKDYAFFMRDLALRYPKAEKITLVQDNLKHAHPKLRFMKFSMRRRRLRSLNDLK